MPADTTPTPLPSTYGGMSLPEPPEAPQDARSYWEPIWQQGRRYRTICEAEAKALRLQLGEGRGRPALDIGCGEGELTRRLAQFGYRTTGIDCAPTAVTKARRNQPDLDVRRFDFDADDLTRLPSPAFAVVACRLVYRWVADKPAFLSRVRHLLVPGGIFWVATSVHDPAQGTPRPWDITAGDAELLATGWSQVRVSKIDPSFHCYSLRP
ncbi:class I SAM-dependent methyltransferase [Streptomyces sp. NPDC047525]|uniref:class I SAM-dependent methyltransferase n=1 Tax=Streptomyces sp. NPDC047525 TaxID=3155264 RepID=UPI0033DF1EFF